MKKLTVLVACICILLCGVAFSEAATQVAAVQAPDIEWAKCLGGSSADWVNSIQQTSDGGYIVAGYTHSNDGDVSGNRGYGWRTAWVIKLDAGGGIEWQKCLGGSDFDDANSIRQTNDGGYIVAGLTRSKNSDVSGNNDGDNAWVVKLDTNGDIEWKKSIGGTGDYMASSIRQTNDGGYIVAGATNSNDGDLSGNRGGDDAWIVKLDTNGDIEWQKCIGGSVNEMANSIQQTNDGGYIVAGYTNSDDGDVSGNHRYGYWDAWVVKLNANGSIEWQKCLGGSGNDMASSIQQTNDGGYIVAAGTKSNDGDVSGNRGGNDAWVVKLDAGGSIEWQKCLGGSGNDWANSIRQTNDGGYIVAGNTESNDGDVSGNHGKSDAWVVKLDANGSIEWQKCLGGSDDDWANSIQQTNDGGFIFAGNTKSNNGDVSGNHGIYDAWVVKLAPDKGKE